MIQYRKVKKQTKVGGLKNAKGDYMRNLETGKDYYDCCGKQQGCKMIFLGGIKWECHNGDKKMVLENEKQTKAITEYINRPSYKVGN